jgi:hypothetical protein
MEDLDVSAHLLLDLLRCSAGRRFDPRDARACVQPFAWRRAVLHAFIDDQACGFDGDFGAGG